MADASTTTAPILSLIEGDCWARRQLRSGIKDVSVASKPMKSLSLVRDVFIATLAIPELDGRFLHKCLTDSGSDCGGLLGSTLATQPYRGHRCGIGTQEIRDPCGSCLYMYPGDLTAGWQIPPQPHDRFWIRLREVVGLDAGYATV